MTGLGPHTLRKDIEDEPSEELNNPNDDDIPLRAHRQGGININPFTVLEDLFVKLRADPTNGEVRAHLERIIKRCYMEHGGVPVNTESPVPVDISSLTNTQLENVADNIQLYINRTQKADLVSRVIGTVTNICRMGSLSTGIKVPESALNMMEGDHLLRDAIVKLCVGNVQGLHPFVIAFIGITSHLTAAVVNSYANYLDQKTKTKEEKATSQPANTTRRTDDDVIGQEGRI